LYSDPASFNAWEKLKLRTYSLVLILLSPVTAISGTTKVSELALADWMVRYVLHNSKPPV
jgi:hypothetical protein